MVRPRKAIEGLQAYHPPLEGRAGKVRLDFNENTVGCAPEVIRHLRRILSADWLSLYPEYEKVRAVLAQYYRVKPQELLITNGADDGIKLICDTFVDPGDLLLTLGPTFAIYQFFHTLAGGKVNLVHYDENLKLPAARALAALSQRARWVALANPNNPTGTLVAQSDLRTILRAAPNTLILVDEAYFDFSAETILPWINKFPNLVVMRTLSKAFGLAGLRLGLMFANRGLAGLLRRAHAAFPVNSVAVACAMEAIRHPEYNQRYVEMVRANRASFCRRLDAMGVAYAPSAANFVLARLGKKAPEIARRLRAQDILVRDWSYDPHLRAYLRITIGTAAHMRRLAGALRRMKHLIEPRQGPRAWRDLMTYSPADSFG